MHSYIEIMSCSLLRLHSLRTSGLNRRQDVSQCLLKEDVYIGKIGLIHHYDVIQNWKNTFQTLA